MSPLLFRLSSRRAAKKQHSDFIADHCQREVQMMSKGGHKEGVMSLRRPRPHARSQSDENPFFQFQTTTYEKAAFSFRPVQFQARYPAQWAGLAGARALPRAKCYSVMGNVFPVPGGTTKARILRAPW